jgi:hypothetical protein
MTWVLILQLLTGEKVEIATTAEACLATSSQLEKGHIVNVEYTDGSFRRATHAECRIMTVPICEVPK